MARRSANEKLNDSQGLPTVQHVDPESKMARTFGSGRMLIAAPIQYDEVMRGVPAGRLTTADRIRSFLAANHEADFTCPLTAGLFINVVARASEERREAGSDDITPYWRTLKKGGELNDRYPGGVSRQRLLLEAEGHEVVDRGKRRFVKDYEAVLHGDLEP